jgi:hypothetical protein
MKKLVQISLVVIVVLVLLLVTVGAPNASVDKMSSDTAQSISATASTAVPGTQVASCSSIKSVNCAPSKVGWNS